jgi:nucleoside-diphosphate-sugar epimerase
METRRIRFLVTGANGFVGHALCKSLMQKGHDVGGVVRSNDVILDSGVSRFVVGDINSHTDWTAALDGVDVIIHLAARVHVMKETSQDALREFRSVNVSGTERLALSAAASGVKRLVFVSSIKVNGEETIAGHRYSELDVPMPKEPYGVSKWEAEQALQRIAQETGLEVVVVRPPLVYGPGVKGNFTQMMRVVAKGIPLPLASVNNLRSLVYVGNFVDALFKCATYPAAAGKTYLVSDAEDVSTPDLLRQLGATMKHPARLFPFPPTLLHLAGRMLGRSEQIDRLLGSLQVDSSKLRRELDWHPPYVLQQGLQATAQWYRNLKT